MSRVMKDSGIPWIGEIPEEWEVKKIKFLAARDIQDSFIDGDWIESPYIQDSGIRYLTTGNIGDGKYKEQGNGFISEKTFEDLNCKYAYPDDLVFSRLNSPYGRTCLLPSTFPRYVLAVDNVILRTHENKLFISFVSQCAGYQKSVEDKASGTTMKRISRTNLGNILLPMPPLAEQEAIAEFLDRKCGEVDEMVALQEQVIEELKAYKQSIITEAVTKGLDPNAPMKPSHIDWIGNIPSHWSQDKVIRAFKTIGSGTTPSSSDESAYDGSINWIQSGDINGGDLFEVVNRINEDTLKKYSALFIYQSPFIVIAMYGASVGNISISHIDGCVNQACCVLSEPILNLKYAFYTLKSSQDYLIYKAVGGGQPNISQKTIKQLWVPVPPDAEQREIADYLDRKCADIDALIALKQQKIEVLREYKKSLIYEYVTGKKEVSF